MKLDFSDDVISSLALLRCLDDCYDSVGSYFEKNLQLSTRKPKLEFVQELIGNSDFSDSQYFQRCLDLYRAKMNPDDT